MATLLERELNLLLSDIAYIDFEEDEKLDEVLNLTTERNPETGNEEYVNKRWYEKYDDGTIVYEDGEPKIREDKKDELESVKVINKNKDNLLNGSNIISVRYGEVTGMKAIAELVKVLVRSSLVQRTNQERHLFQIFHK